MHTLSENSYSYILYYDTVLYRSWYIDWLRAGQQRGRSSSLGRGKILIFSTSSIWVLGPNQPPIQWVSRALSPGVKPLGLEADHSPPTSAKAFMARHIITTVRNSSRLVQDYSCGKFWKDFSKGLYALGKSSGVLAKLYSITAISKAARLREKVH
jgi:hypothetical protein